MIKSAFGLVLFLAIFSIYQFLRIFVKPMIFFCWGVSLLWRWELITSECISSRWFWLISLRPSLLASFLWAFSGFAIWVLWDIEFLMSIKLWKLCFWEIIGCYRSWVNFKAIAVNGWVQRVLGRWVLRTSCLSLPLYFNSLIIYR